MRLFLEHTFNWLYKSIKNPNYRRFIFYSFFYGKKKRFISRNFSFNGLKIFVPDTLSFIWQYKGIFADEDYKFFTDSSNPIIYDCGANIGISCLYFAQNYPASIIKAFEADPNISKILNNNLIKNNIKNVTVVNKAVWINNDGVSLSLEGADGATIFSENNQIKVPSIRLKDLLENEKQIDMLKIDIEGAEYEVLMDCRDSLLNVKNIFIEYHSFNISDQNLSEILQILQKNKFRYFIKSPNNKDAPLINKKSKFNQAMDLQLNIFGYKIN